MDAAYSIVLSLIYTIIIELLIFRFALGIGMFRLLGRVTITNIASWLMAVSIAASGYYYLGWESPMSWGGSHWFLLIVICEFLPLSIFFGHLGFRRVFTLLVFANIISILFLSFLVVYAPVTLRMPDRELEVQQQRIVKGIQVIRDALEKYRTATGEYPGYIFGGDSYSWGKAGEAMDPLLKGGYLEAYPYNPYHLGNSFYLARRRAGLQGFFWGIESESFTFLKKMWEAPMAEDPRFGFRGTRMGNILSDRKTPASRFGGDYRVYRGKDERMVFMPGSFLYRAYDTDNDGKFDSYIIAGFGPENGRGEDIYDYEEDRVAYVVEKKLYPGRKDGKPDGVIIVDTGGYEKWRD